jgi:hypothetical protein
MINPTLFRKLLSMTIENRIWILTMAKTMAEAKTKTEAKKKELAFVGNSEY